MSAKISIVYLTKNGGATFEKSLRSVLGQKIANEYEVICVDSGSTDSTLDTIQSYSAQLYQISPQAFSFGPARDYAFSKANGEIIVTLSQDVVPVDENWLYFLTQPFCSSDVSAVQGKDVRPEDSTTFFWERKGFFYFTQETKRWLRLYGLGLSCTNMAIRKSVWNRYRFGNTPMSEDKALQLKLVKAGLKIVYSERAIASHGHTYTLASLIRRCENEGLGWRYAGVSYSAGEMVWDIVSLIKYLVLIWGVASGGVRSWAEVLFPLVRPVYLYKGNHLSERFRH